MSRLGICLALVFAHVLPISAAEPSSLEAQIVPIAKAHKGKVAVAVKDLQSGEEFYLNADEPMPTASLIKLAIMVEAYKQADEKKLDLSKMVTLTKDDKVPGSGILTSHFSDGATFCVRDAIRLMIAYSDNTATNLVLDQVGIKNVNTRMEELGLKNTRVHAKVFKGSTTSIDPERTKKYGLGSITAREAVQLLELIQTNKAASPESCQAMIAHLKTCDDKDKMTRLLPAGTVVAHKTGSVDATKTDAGIIYSPNPKDKKKPRPVALCVLTTDNEDKRWVKDNAGHVTIGKIARVVYDNFTEKK